LTSASRYSTRVCVDDEFTDSFGDEETKVQEAFDEYAEATIIIHIPIQIAALISASVSSSTRTIGYIGQTALTWAKCSPMHRTGNSSQG
jgi:hypothetical protein